MFSFRLEKPPLAALAETVFKLCDEFANEADLYISSSSFLLITSNSSFGLVAALDIRDLNEPVTGSSAVGDDRKCRVSLPLFHRAMLDGESYSSLTIFIPEFIPRLTLRFENPTPGVEPVWLHRALTFSPTQEETLCPLEGGKAFQIHAEEFRRIVRDAPLSRNDSICVITVTKSEVKFSTKYKDTIFTEQSGRCEIIGYGEEEGETPFLIPLHPKSFFLRWTNQAESVWFQKTVDDSYNVISIPDIDLAYKHVVYVSQHVTS